MAWTDLTFSYGSQLTSTQMTQLFNNFESMAHQDSGAPLIYAPTINIPQPSRMLFQGSATSANQTSTHITSGWIYVPGGISSLSIQSMIYLSNSIHYTGDINLFRFHLSGTLVASIWTGSGNPELIGTLVKTFSHDLSSTWSGWTPYYATWYAHEYQSVLYEFNIWYGY